MPVFIQLTNGVLCCDRLPQNVLTHGFKLAVWVMYVTQSQIHLGQVTILARIQRMKMPAS
jgi:hypothetical protein